MQILKNAEQTCSEIQAMATHSQPKESELRLLGTIPNFKTIHNIATTLIKYTSFKMNSRKETQICLYYIRTCKQACVRIQRATPQEYCNIHGL
jgi:hypothetical protein